MLVRTIDRFETQGYLVVEDVLPHPRRRCARIRRPARRALCGLAARGPRARRAGDFRRQLLAAYRAGCDWFQPMDISLPGDAIRADTPMHFGPAVFDIVTAPRLLDLVEDLIGPEITSNPIQHVRIKPPATDLRGDEIRAHITATDWHQDRGVALPRPTSTSMVTVWCAITDATVENGCLQVIPGSHAMLPHCPKTQTAHRRRLHRRSTAIPLPVQGGRRGAVPPADPACLAGQPTTGSAGPSTSASTRPDSHRAGAFPRFHRPQRRASRHRAARLARGVRCGSARARLAAPHISTFTGWSSDAPHCA